MALRPLALAAMVAGHVEAASAQADAQPRSPEGATAPPQAVTVTGTRLTAAAAQSAQDVHVYDRGRIERSGQTTVSDFLATVPEVSLASVESSNLATTVRLRGAVPGSVLVLINGRRTEPTTGSAATSGFFDVATIPLAMVQRIEVLPAGSSAIYGGDALAGVVNIVLRSDFSGAEGSVGYKWAKNTDETLVHGGTGLQTDRFGLSVMASYDRRSALYGTDRAITASPDYRRLGGPNLGNRFFGAPATVSAVSGNLPGLDASFAAVPAGSSGIGLTPADFAATAGTQNTGGFTAYQSLVPDSMRKGAYLSANYRVSGELELFAELLASRYELHFASTPAFLQLARVPASNAFNPFGADVLVSGVVQGAERLSRLDFDDDFFRPLVGARGGVDAWAWEFTAQTSRDQGHQTIHGQPDAGLLGAALASSDPATALNPFVDGPMASPAILSSIYSTTRPTAFKGQSNIVDGFMRGPLLALPAGSLDAVVGAEFDGSSLERGFDAHRTAKALFTELRAPLVAAPDGRDQRRVVLSVQGAARVDSYSDFGSRTTWQAGLEFRPAADVLLRGTHATAFKPPTLYNLAALASVFTTTVTDPQRSGETVAVQATTGGNRDLRPTTGRSSSAGIVWSPLHADGLNVTTTWWQLDIDDAVSLPSVQFVVNNESLYPGRVVRAPAAAGAVGQITAVDYSYVNFGAMHERGIDASIDCRFTTRYGSFAPSVSATYIARFAGASTPGSASVDRDSRANSDGIFAPRWKAGTAVAWDSGEALRATLGGRYTGRYRDFTPTRTIGNVWYLDGSLEVAVEPALGKAKGSLGGMKLLLTGTNLRNKLPPYSTYFRGYDVYNYDLVGRTFFLRLQWQT
jgi:iron complex outermembrane receptor protein